MNDEKKSEETGDCRENLSAFEINDDLIENGGDRDDAEDDIEKENEEEEPNSSQYVTASEDPMDNENPSITVVDVDSDDYELDDNEDVNRGSDENVDNVDDPLMERAIDPHPTPPTTTTTTTSVQPLRDLVVTKKKSNANAERGVVYLSSIPTAMDLQQIRNALGNCGRLGRVFLQEDHNPQKKRAKRSYYSEGWVEFKSKKDAKRTAKILNCAQVGGKKRHPWFADTWNIKYLPRFKWHHLVDRLAYERAVEEQKMRIEVGAARKEAHHFRELVDKADGDKRTVKKGKEVNRKEWQFYQKQTEEEIKKVIERKSEEAGGNKKMKKKRKNEEAGEELMGKATASPTELGGKKRKKEVREEKKLKKRELIKSIFQGGGDSDVE